MSVEFKSEKSALGAVYNYGAKVLGDTIYPPEEIGFSRFQKEHRDEFWDAMKYLQLEHDYKNGNNEPLFEFDDEDEY